MYYLINKTTNKVIDENEKKSKLRRKQKGMSNGQDFIVSKFKDKEVKEKKVKEKKRLRDTSQVKSKRKGFSRRESPDTIINTQIQINDKRMSLGLKIIVEIPSIQSIVLGRSRSIDPVKLYKEQQRLTRLTKKYGSWIRGDDEDIIICSNRKELRKIRRRKKNYNRTNKKLKYALLKIK